MTILPYPVECLICRHMTVETPCPFCGGAHEKGSDVSKIERQEQPRTFHKKSEPLSEPIYMEGSGTIGDGSREAKFIAAFFGIAGLGPDEKKAEKKA